ncbi:MAG TPA: AsmA-like C-terminal region-containing protein, partial [Candidatus Acidoferrum sp.]|nr:AsmA-like C-terminal region-containing protein [Candidatus Acidoferrum sp.]
WKMPGFASALNIRAVRGGTQRGKLLVEPFQIAVPSRTSGGIAGPGTGKNSPPSASPGAVTVSLLADVERQTGSVGFEGQLQQVEAALAAASAFGHELRRGWELTGKAAGELRWEWGDAGHPGWTGHADLSRASLRVAGLNQPIQWETVRADWRDTTRKFTVANLAGFGATWSGTLEQTTPDRAKADDNPPPQWEFQLQADQLDAAELDRWIGPRARPSWIQRLLPSALGGASQSSPASAVLQGIRAEGDLKVDLVDVERIRLQGFRAHAALSGLRLTLDNAQAQWSGGMVTQGHLAAALSSHPTYEVSASFSRVSLTGTPWLQHLADRLTGAASGTLELRAGGIGREALLKSLNGKGELRLEKIELRGWDLAGTMARGEWKPGISRWPTGAGTFHISDGGFELNAMRLASPSDEFLLKGSVSFSEDADLTAESHATGRNAKPESAIRFLTISGPLTEPKVSLERTTAQQPGD